MAAGIKNFIVSIFLNDIKVFEVKGLKMIIYMKEKLTTAFKMIDISLISFYFSLKIDKNCEKNIFKLLQLIYINKILIKYYLN